MIRSAENYILVEIEKKYQDKNGYVFIDTTWLPEEFATLEGTVISAPLTMTVDKARPHIGSVAPGEKLFFSYSVVYDYALQPEDDTPVYKNLVILDGKEYWKVHPGEVFCKIKDDGALEMITDNILLEIIDTDLGRVKAMPTNINLSCNVRDVVCFEPRFVQKYNIFGAEHYIIPSRRIFAKTWI